jgi:hypothetical protein
METFYSLTVSRAITHLYTGGASGSQFSMLVASIKRSGIIKESRTDIRTVRRRWSGALLDSWRRLVLYILISYLFTASN